MGFTNTVTNIVDGAVRVVAPGYANRRAAERVRYEYARQLAERRGLSSSHGGFESASRGRDTESWFTSRLSPDSAIEESRQTQLERADSAIKNFELGVAHVEGRVVRVIGRGFALDPSIEPGPGVSESKAGSWNEILREAWVRQSRRIGKGNQPYRVCQQLMHRHYERHGEWFLLIGDKFDPLSPTPVKVEVIHPKRVETPPEKSGDPLCRMGVQLDADGAAIGYYVRDAHPGDTKNPKETYTYYPAYLPNGLRRMIHHFDPIEAGQHRGYPRLQAGLKRLKNAKEYEDAELERNYVAACHAAFVRTDQDMLDVTAGDVTDADGKRLRTYAPGTINYLGLTDEITLSNPGGAPQSYDNYIQHQARQFAAAAGTSYEVLANDFRGMNYSTSRVLWNIEDAVTGVIQKSHAETLVEVYAHFVNRLIVSGDLLQVDQVAYRSEPWRYQAVRVIPPAKASIDPAREDRNELTLIEAGIKPGSDFIEQKTGEPSRGTHRRVKRFREERRELGLEEHMPNMGRDQVESGRSPSQPGDPNPESSDANNSRQEVAA